MLVSGVMSTQARAACPDLLQFTAPALRSKNTIDFCDTFAGKPLLVVNTASQCGFTPQFADLEALYQQYGGALNVVGFPSDDFNQEHDSSEAISDVCYLNYGVTFTMVEPSSVRGADANGLFARLAQRAGIEPQWNFTKYLISPDGEQVTHFASRVKPTNAEVTDLIDSLID